MIPVLTLQNTDKFGLIKKIFILGLLFFSCSENTSDGPHIRKDPTIEFYLNKKASMLTEIVVRETFQNWADKTHFNAVYKGRHRPGLHKDSKNTISFLVKWPEEIPINKVAYCKNWYDSKGNIIESDMIFNMMITRFTTLKTNTQDSYYIEGVLTHEIGHMIGLDHVENDSSVMKYKSDAKESFFKGNIDDITLAAYRKSYNIKP
ncbi:MAG: matrixin family metalloprotease [Spirochaetes bacterium]|jgi:predicted Zn-dependent protease|nr:matrixin family metalloprotease [Spirochaetota bacterium]